MTRNRISRWPAAASLAAPIMLLLTCCGDSGEDEGAQLRAENPAGKPEPAQATAAGDDKGLASGRQAASAPAGATWARTDELHEGDKRLEPAGAARSPKAGPATNSDSEATARAQPPSHYLEGLAHEAIDHTQVETQGQGNAEKIHQRGDDSPYSGWIREYDGAGTLRGLVQVEDGRLDGLAFQWDEHGGKKKKGSYRRGVEHGPYLEWHGNGQKRSEGRYHEGRPEGTWVQWHANGQISQRTDYREGMLEGPSTTWNERGKKLREGHHQQGKPEGLWTAYYADGKKERESRYRDGKPEGLWIAWYPNGQKQKEVTFGSGLMNGPYAEWREGGQMMSRGSYRNGELDGVTTTWKENGEPDEELQFRNGTLVASGPAPAGSSDSKKVAATAVVVAVAAAADRSDSKKVAARAGASRKTAAAYGSDSRKATVTTDRSASRKTAARADPSRGDAAWQPASSPKQLPDEPARAKETTAELIARSKQVREKMARVLAAAKPETATQPTGQAPGRVAGLSPQGAATARPTVSHLVKPGESLWSISRRYKVSISELKTANGLRNDMLRAGDRLRIPRGDQP